MESEILFPLSCLRVHAHSVSQGLSVFEQQQVDQVDQGSLSECRLPITPRPEYPPFFKVLKCDVFTTY